MVRAVVYRLRAVLHAVASPKAAAAFALPPAVAVLLACGGAIGWQELLGAFSFRLWCAMTILAVVVGTVRAIVARHVPAALAGGAVLALLAHGGALAGLGMEAEADVGEGEEGFAWKVAFAGPLAKPVNLAVLEIPEQPAGDLRLLVDGREFAARVGQDLSMSGGLVIGVRGVYAAPAFSVRRAGGAIEGEGLLKLLPGIREYFQVAVLPHRFYVTLASPPPDGAVTLPGHLHLRVQRGKVSLLERDVAIGEPVQVEGLTLRFGSGARWARIGARRAPPPWMLLFAAAFGGSALGAAWRERHARKDQVAA